MMLVKVTLLNNDQIKALPTTPVIIVPSPGAGRIIQPVSVMFITNFVTNGYTNQSGDVRIGIPPQNSNTLIGSSWLIYDADAFGVFNAQGEKFIFAPVIGTGLDAANPTAPNGFNSDFENTPLKLVVTNSASGNFTGGDAANDMRIIVQYLLPHNT